MLVKKKKISFTALADIARQMGSMLSSGMDLVSIIACLWERESSQAMRDVYQKVLLHLQNGLLLSDAMEQESSVFPEWMVNMVRAGEAGGGLADVMLQVARTYDREAEYKRKVSSACLYPVFLLFLTVASMVILFYAILPRLFVLIESSQELPSSTKFLIRICGIIENHGYPLILFLTAVILVMYYIISLPAVRYWIDIYKLKLPWIGKWYSYVYTSRFAISFSMLYTQGISVLDAVKISSSVIGNQWMEKQIMESAEYVWNGALLSEALETVAGLESGFCINLAAGEKSGQLKELLIPMAERFEQEADEILHRVTVLIEPVFIVLIAALIGIIMWSVLIPIYQYYQSML